MLGSYIRQNMKFFVAKVNLGEQARLGFNYLRPLQVAYESPKFMLPIRLGTVNANGAQELFVYVITTQRPRRDDELSDGQAAERRRRAALRPQRFRAVLQSAVLRAGQARGR